MDSEIISLFDGLAKNMEPGKLQTVAKLAIIDDSTGELEITIGDVAHRRVVKPLKDLYGRGINAPTLELTSDEYRPLLMEIERSITEFDRRRSRLTDATVASTLNRMGINPESPSGSDELEPEMVQRAGLLSQWVECANTVATKRELERLATSAKRGRPLGHSAWATKTVAHLELAHAVRPEGRPRRVVTGGAES